MKALFSAQCVLLMLLLAPWCAAQKPSLIPQTGHDNTIESVAFSRDGKLLVSADGTGKIWDARNGVELRTFQNCERVVFGKDDGYLVGAIPNGGKLGVWDIKSGDLLRTLNTNFLGIASIALEPSSGLIAAGQVFRGNSVVIFDPATGRQVKKLEWPGKSADLNNPVTLNWLLMILRVYPDAKEMNVDDLVALNSVGALAFSPEGKFLASGDSTNTIRIWDIASGETIHMLNGHENEIGALAFGSDGKMLASASKATIKIWDVPNAIVLRTLTGHTADITSLRITADGGQIISGSKDGTIKHWDAKTGNVLSTISNNGGSILSIDLSVDGQRVASGGEGRTIRIWDKASGAEVSTMKAHSLKPGKTLFSPNGKLLATFGSSIKIWSLSDDAEVRTLEGGGRAAAFSPDSSLFAAADLKQLRIWNLSNQSKPYNYVATDMVDRKLFFNSTGSTLAAIGYDEAAILDSTTGVEKLAIHNYYFPSDPEGNAIAISSNGQRFAAVVNEKQKDANGKNKSGAKFLRAWDVSGKQQLAAVPITEEETVKGLTFSTDGNRLFASVASETQSSEKTFDVMTGNLLRSKKLADGADDLRKILSPNGKLEAVADANLKLYDDATGRELATLIAFEGNQWAVITPDGLFDGSPEAWHLLVWRFGNNSLDYAPVEAYFNEYYYPGLLRALVSGQRPKATSDISQKDRRQPQLKVMPAGDVGGSPTVREGARSATVKIDVTESAADKGHKTGSGAQDVRLFRNGSLVKVWHGDVLKGQSSVTLNATIPIIAGENKLTAYAFNNDNIKSSDAELIVTGAESLKRQGTAYILAVGVNTYTNSQYNLKYAVADAEDFSAEVKRQQESLKRYARVEVIPLSDAQATKAAITNKLAELAKQIQPEDTVIVFFAGHGTAQGNQFYLIPHDLGYDGPRENLSAAGLEKILAHSISDRELEKLFEGIDAGQLLLVIDACNSGQALEAEEKRRGPMNSKGLAQLAYEKGMYVLTAAQSYQAAIEAERFGHGYLTYALIEEGLKKGSADREPKNGAIDIREWLNFATDEVPKMQEQSSLDALRGRGRYVVFVGDGRKAGNPKTAADARDNIQRPRVFYRRELEANPLVVGAVGAGAPQ